MIKIAPSVMCMDLLALGAQIHQLDSMGVDMYPVSYTHLDVYKRQPCKWLKACYVDLCGRSKDSHG